MLFFFFFSSRRRHTRLQGDWSSDVCSSDLAAVRGHDAVISAVGPAHTADARPQMLVDAARALTTGLPRAGVRRLLVVGGAGSLRSEERRVGEEGRSRGAPYH